MLLRPDKINHHLHGIDICFSNRSLGNVTGCYRYGFILRTKCMSALINGFSIKDGLCYAPSAQHSPDRVHFLTVGRPRAKAYAK